MVKQLSVFLAVLLLASPVTAAFSARAGEETWAIYWYVCGSDLETDGGCATDDLAEATNGVTLPDNVKLIIQTGGSKQWQNDVVDADAMYRLAQTGHGLEIVGTVPPESMGSPETLYGFLEFCEKNYPADRKALIFWNHGAGSGGGVCYDELHDDDCITFLELKTVLEMLYGDPDADEKPFELIGFDACLMATLDMAGLAAPYARYLVASEEIEPGIGWKYDGILGALAENPGMDGAELSRVICDSYYEGCYQYGLEGNVTLSAIDLAKVEKLNLAMSMMYAECFGNLSAGGGGGSSEFYAAFGRGVKKADSYGGGMVDLGSLVQANAGLFPNAAEHVAEAIDECVIYQVKGRYRKNSNGIAVYYPSGGDGEAFQAYEESAEAGGMKSLYFLYEPIVRGEMSCEAFEFLSNFEKQTAMNEAEEEYEEEVTEDDEEITDFQFADTSAMGFAEHPAELVEEDGVEFVQLNLGQKAKYLQSVTVVLYACDPEADTVTLLGEDSDVGEDWDAGVFRDNFRGTWMGIDGHIVNTNVTSVTDEYILYEVPIYIEDRLYNLTAAYEIESGEYKMLSARPDESETGGIPAKEGRLLKPGDKITTVFDVAAGDDAEITAVKKETFTITEDSEFGEITLPDGLYSFMFLMVDCRDEVYSSVMTDAEVTDGEASFVTE